MKTKNGEREYKVCNSNLSKQICKISLKSKIIFISRKYFLLFYISPVFRLCEQRAFFVNWFYSNELSNLPELLRNLVFLLWAAFAISQKFLPTHSTLNIEHSSRKFEVPSMCFCLDSEFIVIVVNAVCILDKKMSFFQIWLGRGRSYL